MVPFLTFLILTQYTIKKNKNLSETKNNKNKFQFKSLKVFFVCFRNFKCL